MENPLDPQLMLEQAEANLASARELLTIAEERIIFAKQRAKFAQERKTHAEDQLALAREIAINAHRLLSGANELCRLGLGYIQRLGSPPGLPTEADQVQSDLDHLVLDARNLSDEANLILSQANAHQDQFVSRLSLYLSQIEQEQTHYEHEVSVWFNANELVNLTEDQLKFVQAYLQRAEDRMARAQARLGRHLDRQLRAQRSGI